MSEGRNLSAVGEPDDAPPLPDDGPDSVVVDSMDGQRHHYIIVDPVDRLAPAGHLGTRVEIEEELDVIALALRRFHRQQPDQRMREIAAFSARLTELCVLLHRVESQDRQYTRVRTQQVERFLAELDRQWKIASRLIEVQRQDIELMR